MSIEPSEERAAREPARWGFASGSLRAELTALAFAGGKVVTTGLLAEYEIDGDPVESPGDISILLDLDDQPLALVEDVRSQVVRLADVTDEDAIDEGEGYADSAAFRVAHERFWNGYIEDIRGGLGDPGFSITDDTPVVVERFRLVAVCLPDGAPIAPRVRPAYPADRPAVDAFLAGHNADLVARRGELVDSRQHPALIVERDGVVAGVLTWVLTETSMEILTLHVDDQWAGTGTALLAAAGRIAEASGATRLWAITTNDNVDALRFYQRRGLALVRAHPGAVDRSRDTRKPAIPAVGDHGIPMHDELELEMAIGSAQPRLTADVEELLAIELALGRRDEAAIPGGYEAVVAPDFTEIGSSGKWWSRTEILAAMRSVPVDESVRITRFELVEIEPTTVLVTFDAFATGPDGAKHASRRSSIWTRLDGRWQLRFNQGTPLADPPD